MYRRIIRAFARGRFRLSEGCLSIIVAAMLFGSANAVAEGAYAGIGVGSIQIDEDSSFYPAPDYPFGYRIFAGIQPGRSLAFEAVFLKSDFTTQSNLSDRQVRISGLVAYGAASTPAGDSGRVMARVGWLKGDREIKLVDRVYDTSAKGLALGLGYVFSLTEHIAIRGDFDTFLLSDVDNLSSLTIGIQFGFGD